MFRFDSKNKSLSRILVLALACLLVVTSMPAGTFRAFADETEIPAESGIVPEVPEQEIAQDDEATPGSTQGGVPAVEDPVEMQSEEMDGMINTALRIVNADQADAGGNADGTGEEGEAADAKEGELAAAAVEVNADEQAAACRSKGLSAKNQIGSCAYVERRLLNGRSDFSGWNGHPYDDC